MPLKITEADIEAFQNDGAVLIKSLLNNQEVSDLREGIEANISCLLYTSPSPRDLSTSRMPSSA